jgi:hypothetical protein
MRVCDAQRALAWSCTGGRSCRRTSTNRSLRRAIVRRLPTTARAPHTCERRIPPTFRIPWQVMGHSSDRLAAKWGVSRQEQDDYAYRCASPLPPRVTGWGADARRHIACALDVQRLWDDSINAQLMTASARALTVATHPHSGNAACLHPTAAARTRWRRRRTRRGCCATTLRPRPTAPRWTTACAATRRARSIPVSNLPSSR